MAAKHSADSSSRATRRYRWINGLLAVLGAAGFAAALYGLALS